MSFCSHRAKRVSSIISQTYHYHKLVYCCLFEFITFCIRFCCAQLRLFQNFGGWEEFKHPSKQHGSHSQPEAVPAVQAHHALLKNSQSNKDGRTLTSIGAAFDAVNMADRRCVFMLVVFYRKSVLSLGCRLLYQNRC